MTRVMASMMRRYSLLEVARGRRIRTGAEGLPHHAGFGAIALHAPPAVAS